MFGRRCSLCNGKLDSKKVCKECGLDNSKSEKYYRINQSNCDDLPLTHVHEDTWDENSEKKIYKKAEKPKGFDKTARKSTNAKSQNKYNYQWDASTVRNKKDKKEKRQNGSIGRIIGILVVVLGLIPSVGSLFESLTDSSHESVEYEYNPYENLDWGHPDEGEYVTYSLESGEYIVGIHIAEGDYEAFVNDDFDVVQVNDLRNNLYLYEYQDKEKNYLNDLRLFYGAKVTIYTDTEITLESYNAQPENMTPMIENPIKDSYILETGYEAKAGLDLEAGVYDIHTDADYAYFTLTIVEEDGTEWEQYGYFEIGADTDKGEYFYNLVLPEGAKIYCEEGDMELIPSEMIGDYDYSHYYP